MKRSKELKRGRRGSRGKGRAKVGREREQRRNKEIEGWREKEIKTKDKV